MPEACFVCIDTSESMRNGDYFPTRLMAAQDAANMLICRKIESNPENTIGFLTMGNKSVNVIESLTNDADAIMESMTSLSIGGTKLFFSNALLIASLALSYRSNPKAEKRVIAFVGSELVEDEKALEKIARKLRKDDVSVDVITFGEISRNNDLLKKFIDDVNKNDNSHFLICPRGGGIVDHLYNSPILLGNDGVEMNNSGGVRGDTAGAAAVMAGPTDTGGTSDFEFGVDPNVDPELAAVLRMSAEEERVRLERVAATAASAGAGGGTTSASSPVLLTLESDGGRGIGGNAVQQPSPQTTTTFVNEADFHDEEDEINEDDEDLRRAIAMSLQEEQERQQTLAQTQLQQQRSNPALTSSTADGFSESGRWNTQLSPVITQTDAVVNDPELMHQLLQQLENGEQPLANAQQQNVLEEFDAAVNDPEFMRYLQQQLEGGEEGDGNTDQSHSNKKSNNSEENEVGRKDEDGEKK